MLATRAVGDSAHAERSSSSCQLQIADFGDSKALFVTAIKSLRSEIYIQGQA